MTMMDEQRGYAGRQPMGGASSSSNLITVDRVSGTAVYNHANEKLGTIDSVLIDKYSGEVAYVIMSFGGFLGIGEKFHPLPWDVLDYDTDISGYRVNLDRDALNDAPSYTRSDIDGFAETSAFGAVDDYYLAPEDHADSNSRDGINRTRAQYSRPAPPARAMDQTHAAARDGNADEHGFYSPESQAARNAGLEGIIPATGEGSAADARGEERTLGDGVYTGDRR